MELERGFRQCPTAAKAVGQFARIGITGHTCRHALLAFKNVLRPGQPVSGQVGGQQTIGRGLGGVQLLGVGGVTQELPQSGRLGAGAAQQVGKLLLVEVQQLAYRHGGSQGADGGCGVEDTVVRAAEEFANADARLVTGHRGQDQLAPALAQVLGGGQRGGEHHGSRMQHRAVVQVILLDQMRAGTVDQGGEIGRAGLTVDQNLRFAAGRPHLLRIALEQRNRVGALAGQGRGQPVEKQVFGAADNRLGQLFVAQAGEKFGKRLGVLTHVCFPCA